MKKNHLRLLWSTFRYGTYVRWMIFSGKVLISWHELVLGPLKNIILTEKQLSIWVGYNQNLFPFYSIIKGIKITCVEKGFAGFQNSQKYLLKWSNGELKYFTVDFSIFCSVSSGENQTLSLFDLLLLLEQHNLKFTEILLVQIYTRKSDFSYCHTKRV